MNVNVIFENETTLYAKEEFLKYARMMDKNADLEISLGLLSDFGVSEDGIEDAWSDDLYDIRIEKGKGYIAGSNARSILFGVYAFFKSAGCEWVRPGKDGDFVPKYDISNHSFVKRKLADMKFRSQMIEGAISVEHTLDSVEWMAKLGYNSFFIQFVHPYVFYKRWYHHYFNRLKEKENISHEQMEEFTYEIERAIKKRGLLLHNLGHGFFFEPFGIRYYDHVDTVPDEVKPYIAMLNGKREVCGGSINYTQLCYSNPKVRKMLVDYLVQYMKERPLTDVLHVYYADGANNQCECDECRKMIPTDHFIRILNELDEALTENGMDVKVLFPLYVDLLWPPVQEKIKNPDRFIMCLSLARDYSLPLPLPENKSKKIPEYILNDYNPFRGEAKTSLDYVEAWKPHFDKPFMMCSYNMYADHFYDPGYFQVSRRTADDMKKYSMLNCMGFHDCQTMRYGFPHSLLGAVMGDFSFDTSLEFEKYADDYFKGTYGKDWSKARDYLEKITDLFCPCNLRVSEDVVIQDTDSEAEVEMVQGFIGNPAVQKKLSEIPAFVDSFAGVIAQNMDIENPCHQLSWSYLKYHGEYCKRYADYFLALSKKDVEKAYEIGESLMKWLFENEEFLGRHFDVFLLNFRIVRITVVRMRRKLGLPETIKYNDF